MRAFVVCFTTAAALLLTGCNNAAPPTTQSNAPIVKPWALKTNQQSSLSLSGTVRARTETPLAFQVGGRISERLVDAGQSVDEGQTLFTLDPRDFREQAQGAQADLAAANAALRIAQADLARHQELLQHNAVSKQAAEQAELMLREARARREVAQTRLSQAENALDYAQLTAPAKGVLIEVNGQEGQVVTSGFAIAQLAHAGEREVEVYFPEGLAPPETGTLALEQQALRLTLRETAGAVDPQSRTLRARYALSGNNANTPKLQLGSVVRAQFNAPMNETSFIVPLGAINERGNGPHVWRIQNETVSPVPVSIIKIESETALVKGPLEEGEQVVAIGTHLLQNNMAVRVQNQ
ncbi:MAG: efflux transporter periplasmic adaptor subunit [Pusillimonas sp.]|nr:efflux transporter periplasmic adaptor subunit [Pusillimonas sp.]